MLDFEIPLWGNLALFFGSAGVIGVAGVKAAGLADRLADRTGMGEAVTGTVFLGFLTALPGLLASVVAASKGHAALAISNALGGIAVQTTALAVADIAHSRANLEHAAASVPNMMQATMLIALMVLVLCGLSGPNVAVAHVHPATLLLILAAGSAFWLVLGTRDQPMWKPTQTDETVEDEPNEAYRKGSLRKMVVGLVISAGLTGVSGALVAESSENLVEQTGIPEAVVGGLFMALATSLPELVTSVAAVRRGALTLAVSDVVGGNFFDVLFVAGADLFYLQGSIYHAEAVGQSEVFLTSLTILLNVILLAGLIFRQKKGPGNIGFESVLMIVIYLCGFLVISLAL
ncbi:MAG: sodium:calcium antiporter [Planctomycetota bacterium]|nr:MAG: sodium:calcium antiporter [Planctomycetota bacterium]REK19999.1 MAG: sodium:calcium antiporter [Planctomycetota bacterium]REK27566.1 MAG: sodium:calcium antiporter [Planctomycetota bacterium]